ncbi:hypothetical protein E4U53_008017 [Claviceps sorghi]|nr:hypothetical protein E4U53_008017 [Claviceps sorghi]
MTMPFKMHLEMYLESDALWGRLQAGAGVVTINAALRRGRQRQAGDSRTRGAGGAQVFRGN